MHENFEKKHQGEVQIRKFRQSNIFNKNKMSNCAVLYNEVEEDGTKRKKLDWQIDSIKRLNSEK